MRTTVTLDDDVRALVERSMAERGVPFKVALDAIREGLGEERPSTVPSTITRPLGARLDLTHATRLVGELEDEEILRKLALGK